MKELPYLGMRRVPLTLLTATAPKGTAELIQKGFFPNGSPAIEIRESTNRPNIRYDRPLPQRCKVV